MKRILATLLVLLGARAEATPRNAEIEALGRSWRRRRGSGAGR